MTFNICVLYFPFGFVSNFHHFGEGEAAALSARIYIWAIVLSHIRKLLLKLYMQLSSEAIGLNYG